MTSIPTFTVTETQLDKLEAPLLVVPMSVEGLGQLGELRAIDAATGGALGRAIQRRDFRAARDETFLLAGGERGRRRVILTGVGSNPTDANLALRRAVTMASRQASKLGVGSIAVYGAHSADSAEAVVVGLATGAWDFREMKSPVPDAEQRAPL